MKELWEYKNEAHVLIDEIVALGMPRYAIYKCIKNRLGLRSGEEHFGPMATVAQVMRATAILNGIKGRIVYAKKQDKKAANKLLERTPEAIEQKRIRREIAREQKIKAMEKKISKRRMDYAPNLAELQKLASTLNMETKIA